MSRSSFATPGLKSLARCSDNVSGGARMTLNNSRLLATLAPKAKAPVRSRQGLPNVVSPSAPQQLAPLIERLASLRSRTSRPTEAAYLAVLRATLQYVEERNNAGLLASQGQQADSLAEKVVLATLGDAAGGRLNLSDDALACIIKLSSFIPSLLPSTLIHLSEQSEKAVSEPFLARLPTYVYPAKSVYLLCDLLARKAKTSQENLEAVIKACCGWGHPRIAIDLALQADTLLEDSSSVDASTWYTMLTSCADAKYLRGVEVCLDQLPRLRSLAIDQGAFIGLLDMARIHGRPDLVSKAMLRLSSTSPVLKEHQLSALLGATVSAGRVPEAMKMVATIREAGFTPTLDMVDPLSSALSTPDLVDQAFYAAEDIVKAGAKLDIAAINALLMASVRQGDLQRCRAIHSALDKLHIQPDLDTFNLVLDCCLVTGHRALGDTLVSELAAHHLTPDATTYGIMISLCLLPEQYEDAFYYLERMKSDGFKPSWRTYQALLRKCVQSEDKRSTLLLEEMNSLGYRVNPTARRSLKDGRSIDSHRDVDDEQRPPRRTKSVSSLMS